MRTTKFILFSFICISLTSCNVLMQGVSNSGTLSIPTTDKENIAGIKNALLLGTERAVSDLSIENGFYGNQAFKLLLPEEAQTIVENISLIPGGKALVDKAILSINRSAEDAVKEAGPVFKKAIQDMTISDAMGILLGGSNAATQYLQKTTSTELKNLFLPKVQASLKKPLVGDVSTTETWNLLINAYNSAANSTLGKLASLKPVNTQLDQYVTDKALSALFTKMAETENSIRTDPAARTTTLLKRVFGQLDNK
ncbi:MAG TPA: DUF4197 domain-containing protein [Paludibacteraceae bacterium]|nr:DUF4197 domain-containing protein [Paludibacteraceae bacterium]OPZ01409.1 MAG: hypothetical protein BWZ11_01691 [Bacteroidetes bacterium ADurb.BinA395]MBP8966505.1 DUF4197 domain-containing protein [Paludibacteraceae bacterium]HOF99048.1 DUF4197 domain-containing protein [Paludibacteraceae bacterium]HOJ65712.1 DUF4197 domain-containing protein [Paludibacteraceae bacterium]